MKRHEITTTARTYIGTPFHHQGRVKEVGIDCVGLLICVGYELGLEYIDEGAYSRQPDGYTLIGRLERSYFVPVEEYKEGSVIIFWIEKPELPIHAGLVTDYGFIHTYYNAGGVVEHRLTQAWQKRIVRSYDYPGVE